MAIDVVQTRKAEVVADPNNLLTSGQSYIGLSSISSGNRTIILSDADFNTPGFKITIKDESGQPQKLNEILITTQGALAIDGEDQIKIENPYGSITFTSNGVDGFYSSIDQARETVILASTTITQLAPAINDGVAISFSPTDINTASDAIQWVSANDEFQVNEKFLYTIKFKVSAGRLTITNVETLQFGIFVSGSQVGFTETIEMVPNQGIIDRTCTYKGILDQGQDVQIFMFTAQVGAPTDLGLRAASGVVPGLDNPKSAICEILRTV